MRSPTATHAGTGDERRHEFLPFVKRPTATQPGAARYGGKRDGQRNKKSAPRPDSAGVGAERREPIPRSGTR